MCFEHSHVLAYLGMPGPMEFFLIAVVVLLLLGKSVSDIPRRTEDFRRDPSFRRRWFIDSREMEERARDRTNKALTFLFIVSLSLLVALIVLALCIELALEDHTLP